MRPALAAALEALVAGAGTDGPPFIVQEDGGTPLLEALGFAVPRSLVASGAGVPDGLEGLPGDRVVVKLLDPGVSHRARVGGVRVVPRTAEAVGEALEEVGRAASSPAPRFLIQEWVPHDLRPGGELLLGYRWTREFGPVVTLGPGGVEAEVLAGAARPGTLQWIGAPGATDRAGLAAVLEGLPLVELATGGAVGEEDAPGLDGVLEAVEAFLELAEEAPDRGVLGVEVNPLVFRTGRPVALDVLAEVGTPVPRPSAADPGRAEAVGALLQPRSLAVVGASARGANPGRVMLRNAVAAGFPRDRIQVVKEGCGTLEGCRCVPDVGAMDPVDVLAVSVAARAVPPLLEEVARGGKARSVILVTGGMGEGAAGGAGGAGGTGGAHGTGGAPEAASPSPAAELERVLALPGAPVVNGGNCLGIRSRPGGYDTLFLPRWKVPGPGEGPPHPVAVVAQSGAFAVARTGALPWLDPRYLVTVGNQVDLTVGDYLEAFLDDPELRVVAAYVEGFRPGDGRRFLEAARHHRAAGRTLILYRAGRTRHGAEAAVSHTASVAGDYAVTRALAEAAGVLVAETVQDFHDLLALAVRLADRTVAGRRVGLLSNAGFECVAMADGAGDLVPAELGGRTAADLRAVLRGAGLDGIVAPRNPLDVTPIMGDAGFAEAAGLLLGDDGVDVGVVGCVPMTPALQTLAPGPDHDEDVGAPGGMADGLGRIWADTRKAWVAVVDGGPRYAPLVRTLERHGIPVLAQGDRAVRLLGRYVVNRLGEDAG